MSRQSAGGIVVGKGGKIVLVYQHNNSWSFPKGGVDPGETELQAAMREIFEETGLADIALMRELGSYERFSIAKGGVGEDITLGLRKRTLFLFSTEETTLAPQDAEISQARWVTIDEALTLLSHPKDRDFLMSVRKEVEDLINLQS